MPKPDRIPRNPGSSRTARRVARAARAACLAGLLALPLGCGKKEETKPQAQAPDPVPVALTAVRTEAVPREIEITGTLWGDEDATVAAKVAGRITQVHKDVGDRTAANEPLAQIDPTDYELEKRQRELAVAEALAKIGLAELPAADYDPVNVPTVQRAKLQAENAAARFARGRQLFEQQPPRIAAQEFDDLRTSVAVAQRDYDVALLNAKATIEEARARAGELAMAEQRLADTVVRAPNGTTADGKPRTYSISGRQVSVGEYVREGDEMFRLVDDDLVKLRAAVPERYANQIKVGQRVSVTIDASPETFHGQVARINPQIDPTNRAFEIEVIVPNPDRKLKPGSFARGRVQTHTQEGVVFVPRQAVVSFAGVNKVFTVKDGKAQEVRVDLGERRDEWVELRGGEVPADASVVTSGTGKLATGVPVRIESTGAAPADAGGVTKGAAAAPTQASPSGS